MVKAIVFDCFGVIMIDAITAYQEIHNAVAEEIDELDRQADAGFISQKEQINGYKELTGDNEATILDYLKKEHRVNEPIVDIIKGLKKKYKLGMLSNIGVKWYEELVPEEIRKLFDVTVLSNEVGMVKPYPEIYEYLVDKLEVEPNETIFIDDLQENCEGARAIGIQTIHYTDVQKLKKELNSLLA